jgi:dihydroorotase
MTDLVLKGGHVIDPLQGIDRIADVAFAGGRVQAVGDNLPGPARDAAAASSPRA